MSEWTWLLPEYNTPDFLKKHVATPIVARGGTTKQILREWRGKIICYKPIAIPYHTAILAFLVK